MGPAEWLCCNLKRKAGDRCEAGNRCGREEGVEDAMLLALKIEGSLAIRSSWKRLLRSSALLDLNLLRTHPFLTGV